MIDDEPLAEEETTVSAAKSPFRSLGLFFWELIKVFILAVIIIVPIRFFLIQPFFVRGASMEPQFKDGQYLVIDELSYRFREPHRGEVVVFRFPNNRKQFFIKRIIGLPGETVRIENGNVIIQNERYQQGVILNESSYLADNTRTGGQIEQVLGPDEFFVSGDNRAASSDSRQWGPLSREDIIGRAWIRAFPFDEVTIFQTTRPSFVGT